MPRPVAALGGSVDPDPRHRPTYGARVQRKPRNLGRHDVEILVDASRQIALKPSAENVALPSRRPYDLRHTWASLLVAEQRLSIAEIAEQLGDKISTVLDTYTHVMHEWRGRRRVNVASEIRRARERVA